jgi:hypothetical protein
MDDSTQPIGPPVPRQPGIPAPATLPARPGAPSTSLASRLLRTVLVGAGGLVLLVAGLVWDALLHARDPGLAAKEGVLALSNPGHTHGPNPPEVAAATPDERARAEALWKASVANAERWRDPAAAATAGFRFRDEDEAGRGRPVRFLHVPNPAWRADGRVLDPTRPETLVYWNGPGDRLTLVGVMYTAARGTHGPAVGGPITRWHTHESCRDPATRAKLGRPVDGACPPGQVYRRSGEMMHVWFTDDLGTAFARRPPLTALRAIA